MSRTLTEQRLNVLEKRMARKIIRSVWDEQEARERIAQRRALQFALFSKYRSGEKI
jgi:hypothetical protein